jgi:hypothetical protein
LWNGIMLPELKVILELMWLDGFIKSYLKNNC